MTAIRTSAIVGNVVWALFIAFGVLVDGTLVAKVAFAFFGIIALRNIFAIGSKSLLLDKPTALMNICLALFALTIIFVGQYPYDRMGAFGLAIISVINAVALSVGKTDSWIKRFQPKQNVKMPEEQLELMR